MQNCFSDQENFLSFPLWFNDSILEAEKIRSVTRKFFIIPDSTSEVALKMARIYEFNKFHELSALSITEYYENQVISEQILEYCSPKDSYGYACVKAKSEGYFPEYYIIHEKYNYSKKFLAYRNASSGNFLFYLLNEKNWGVLSVDTILQASENDLVSYGTPKHPKRIFQVQNTVNEFNVSEYNYFPSVNEPEEIIFNSYPFRKKRSFIYESNGKCMGFVDSTFSSEHYLSRIVSEMSYKNKVLPESVVYTHFSKDNKVVMRQFEKFSYTFYE